jgi:hypothetical protein
MSALLSIHSQGLVRKSMLCIIIQKNIMSKIVQVLKQLFGSNTREPFVKLVGTDRFQNKFYERLPGKIDFIFRLKNFFFAFSKGNRHYNSTRRFYEPVDYSNVRLSVDPAWEG